MKAVQYFFGQHENEKLVFFSYKHWTHFLKKVWKNLAIFFCAFVVFSFWILYGKEAEQSLFEFIAINQALFFLFYIWFLLHIHLFFIQCIQYIFNLIIITDARLIEVRQGIFFKENIESVDLSKIQDVQGHKNGVLENLFNFGCVSFTFATMMDPKNIHYLPRPLDFVDWLNRLRRRLIYSHEQLTEGAPKANDFFNNKPELSQEDEVII
ncbi:PH domain-containing protein [Candidatus Peregrinibacteria bacterium]|jgi:hypothetical protein|nr:PH domain-containing protein [Candidatus Peregrinibacteria bacterium]